MSVCGYGCGGVDVRGRKREVDTHISLEKNVLIINFLLVVLIQLFFYFIHRCRKCFSVLALLEYI